MTNFASATGIAGQQRFMTVKPVVRYADPAPQPQDAAADPPVSIPPVAAMTSPPHAEPPLSPAPEPLMATVNAPQEPDLPKFDPPSQIASVEPGGDGELPIFQPKVRQAEVMREKYPGQAVINNLMRIAHSNGMHVTSIMIRPDGTVCVSSDPDSPRVLNNCSPRKYTAR